MPDQLMPGEQPLLLVRQHWTVIAGPLAGGVVVLIAAAAGLLLIPAAIGGVRLGGVKVAVAAALAVIVLLWSIAHWLRWRLLTYQLTDRRIIVDGGVLSRYSESIALDRIQNTVLRRRLADRMLGTGEIEIESAGRDGLEVMHRIPRPAQFYAGLLQAMQEMRRSSSAFPGAGV